MVWPILQTLFKDVKNGPPDVLNSRYFEMIVQILMVELPNHALSDDLFHFGKIADPSEAIYVAFNLDHQMIAMTVKVLTLTIYFAVKLVCSFKIKMFSDSCSQLVSVGSGYAGKLFPGEALSSKRFIQI